MIKMNKVEFASFVIGEGDVALWKDVISNESKYIELMKLDDEKITEVISENIGNLDVSDINKLCIKHNLNIEVTDVEAYSCYSCKTTIEWESSHPTNGLMWGCEICGKSFCSKCLEEATGRSMSDSDDVICPDCLDNLNNINFKNITFLKNSLGEDTGNGNIPEYVEEWFSNIDLNSSWLIYLSKAINRYGILANYEVIHPECDNWHDIEDADMWKNMTSCEIKQHLSNVVEKIQNRVGTQAKVILGLETGVNGCHEIGLWFDLNTSSEEIKKTLDSIKDIHIES